MKLIQLLHISPRLAGNITKIADSLSRTMEMLGHKKLLWSYAIIPPKDDITTMFAFVEFIRMRGIIPRKPGNALILQYFGLLATLAKLFQVAGFPIKFSVATVGKTNFKKTSCSTIFTRFYKRTHLTWWRRRSNRYSAIVRAFKSCNDTTLYRATCIKYGRHSNG